jgi:ribosomal protein L31E
MRYAGKRLKTYGGRLNGFAKRAFSAPAVVVDKSVDETLWSRSGKSG